MPIWYATPPHLVSQYVMSPLGMMVWYACLICLHSVCPSSVPLWYAPTRYTYQLCPPHSVCPSDMSTTVCPFSIPPLGMPVPYAPQVCPSGVPPLGMHPLYAQLVCPHSVCPFGIYLCWYFRLVCPPALGMPPTRYAPTPVLPHLPRPNPPAYLAVRRPSKS